MNWRIITTHAALLMAANFFIGIAQGFFMEDYRAMDLRVVTALELGAYAVTFVVCAVIFVDLAIRQTDKTLLHAGVAAVLCQAAISLTGAFLLGWSNFVPTSLQLIELALEFTICLIACLVGTSVGIGIRGNRSLRSSLRS